MVYFSGIDAGTTGIKAGIFDEDGNLCGLGLAEYRLETPEVDYVELDAQVYVASMTQALEQAIAMAGIDPAQIVSCSITGQAETLICVDADGRLLGKAIVWLDNRAHDEAREIEKEFGSDALFALSGQTEMLPCWPAAKILWLRRHQPDLFCKTAKFLMVEDYLGWLLTGVYATCRGLMPSSLYYDIRNGEYDLDMLNFLGITQEQLPQLKNPGEAIGKIRENNIFPLTSNAVLGAAPIDHVAGLLGAGGGAGVAVATTGCTFAACATLSKLGYDPEKRLGTYHGFLPDSFVFLPWAPTAGMLLKYFRDEFCNGESYEELDRLAESVAPGSDGLLLLPHCAGAISPVTNPSARGVAYGITLGHKKGHFARAIMESVAYLLRDNLECLHDLGVEIRELRLLGGAAKSRIWLQIQADAANLPVVTVSCEEAASLGAAILGAQAAGIFPNPVEAAQRMVHPREVIHPSGNVPCYRELFHQYQKLNQLLMPTFGGKL